MNLIFLSVVALRIAQPSWTSSHVALSIEPEGDIKDTEAQLLLRRVDAARAAVLETTGAKDSLLVEVTVCATTQSFTRLSGRPWHSAAAFVRGRIILQPPPVLRRYEDLDATLRHEIAHQYLETRLGKKVPLWFQEGLAMWIADDRPAGPVRPTRPKDMLAVERTLRRLGDRRRAESAYSAAYAAVGHMVGAVGLPRLLEFLPTFKAKGFDACRDWHELRSWCEGW
jgi:hypothetical protein